MSKQSALSKELNKIINTTVERYVTAVSEKYQLETTELMNLWTEVQGSKKKTTKKSGYINFCKVERPKLKKSNPDMPFGDQGKELGKRWKALSKEQQEEWNTKS